MARIIDAFTQFFDNAGNPLIDGHLQFLESATNNTDKTTFNDVNLKNANTNPVRLDGAGRCPNVFGTGVYKVISFADDGLGNPGQQFQQFDPVDGGATTGQWSDWQPGVIYDSGFIATGSDKKNYRSITNGNQGNDPTLGTTNWEELQLGRVWNTEVSYSIADNAFGSDGNLFRSITNDNTGNDPTLDDGSNWLNITSGSSTAEQLDYSADTTMPDSQVIALNPSAGSLVVTLTTTDVGDIKRLINISAFSTTVKLTGTGFLAIPAGDTAFTFKVDGDWYATLDDNELLPASLLAFGTSEVFNSAETTANGVARLTDTKIVVVFRDDGNSGHGTAIIGDISGTTVTFGSEFVYNAAPTTYTPVARLTDTKFVVAFRDDGAPTPNNGHAVIGDVSGTTITFGSEFTFNPAGTEFVELTRVTDSKFCAVYRDGGNSNFGTAIIGDVTGTTITFGTEVVFNSGATADTSVTRLTDTKIAVSYEDDANSDFGTAIIGDISGTVITFGTEVVFNSASTVTTSISRLTDSKFVVAYQDAGNSGNGTAIIGDVTGTVIVYGSETVFESGGAATFVTVDAVTATTFVTSYVDVANSSFGTSTIGTVSGNTITFGSEFVFNSASTTATTVSRVTDSLIVVGYKDVGNSNFGTVNIGQVLI